MKTVCFNTKFIGKVFELIKGFWKEMADSIHLYECLPSKKRCLRTNSTKSEDICDPRYRGPLCQTCKSHYTKFSGFQCTACFSEHTSLALFIVMGFVMSVFLAIYIK